MSKQKAYKFIMSDESINCYGFRVLTNGIDLSVFEKNPVGFWNHRSDDRWKEHLDFPLIKWVSLKKENGQLVGECIVDDSDEIGKILVSKIENGFINAVSIYFDPIETSEAPEHLLAGQTRSTISKCILLECSLVGLPGNANAVKLKQKEGGSIALNSSSTIKDIDAVVPRITSIKNSNMTIEQKKLLGLSAEATDQEVDEALKALKLKSEKSSEDKPAGTTEALSASDKKELEDLKKERVTTLINQGIADKKFTEAERETYTELANVNFESTKKAIEKMQPIVKLSQMLNRGQSGGTGASETVATKVEDCQFYKLGRSNPSELERMQREDEAGFNAIKNEYLSLVKGR